MKSEAATAPAAPLDRTHAAERLGVTRTALDLLHDSDVIDLHIDAFIEHRLFGYDLFQRHGTGVLNGRFYSHTDLPRLVEAGFTGGLWSITTNPFRTAAGRSRTFFRNLERFQALFASAPDRVVMVRDVGEYRAARVAGRHAVFLSVQGGNALDHSLDDLDRIPERLLVRVTLVHLSTSRLGVTSNPYGRTGAGRGLSALGRDYVRKLDEKRILVDLAHINREGFFDAVAAHDRSLPLIVTHTGVNGVYRHWRNLDDDQLRAVADTGGTVGIMYQSSFLGPSWFRAKVDWVVDHLEHVVDVVGDDHASLGSDWDGGICPPDDMLSCVEFPRLVDAMLRRGWSDQRIRKILGGNFLRVLDHLRPR